MSVSFPSPISADSVSVNEILQPHSMGSFQVIYQVFFTKNRVFRLVHHSPSTAADHPADGKNHL